jgi:hypothetical protein
MVFRVLDSSQNRQVSVIPDEMKWITESDSSIGCYKTAIPCASRSPESVPFPFPFPLSF